MSITTLPAAASGTFSIGGDLPVNRIGYGTMQLTGAGHWGSPADAYGPTTAEHLIRQALHPYRDELVIATKGGMTRQGPNQWAPVGRPEYLRQCVEMSLRRLQLDRIDLYYLHRIDPRVRFEDQIGALDDLRNQGKIRHLGLSKVTVSQIEAAQKITPITAVQNRFNLLDDGDDTVLDYCTQTRIAFVAYAPLAAGALVNEPGNPHAAPHSIRWLLDRAPVVLPIPGTTSLAHLTRNAAAASK
ncbi:aldo/keto reductase [Nocardia vinacea]|uniref:aldo/keto reductase n=1 Tax=Nocardia vinacea TaxID=96468 RepID=UPI00340FE82D